MNVTKLTEDEIKELNQIRDLENNFIAQLGQIEYQIQNLELQKQDLNSQILKFNVTKTNLAQSLQAKYGEGSINIDSGEFIKTN